MYNNAIFILFNISKTNINRKKKLNEKNPDLLRLE